MRHLWLGYMGGCFDVLDLLHRFETLDALDRGRRLGVFDWLGHFFRLDVAWRGVRGTVPNPFVPCPFGTARLTGLAIGYDTIEVLHGHVDFRLRLKTWRRRNSVWVFRRAIGIVGSKALWRWCAITITAAASATATAAPSAASALLAAIAIGARIGFRRVAGLAVGCIVVFDVTQICGGTAAVLAAMLRFIGKIFALFCLARLSAGASLLAWASVFIATLTPSATPPSATFVAATPARVITVGLAARATVVLAMRA